MADDYFNDLDLSSFGLGALTGPGGEDHQASRTSQSPDGTGMRFEIKCDSCGSRQAIDVSWDELIFVSVGAAPPGNANSPAWAYNQRYGTLHPNTPCYQCGRKDTLVMLTPDEANRHLRSGVAAGRVEPGYIAANQQRVRQSQGGYRG